jgi:hypothetical protein
MYRLVGWILGGIEVNNFLLVRGATGMTGTQILTSPIDTGRTQRCFHLLQERPLLFSERKKNHEGAPQHQLRDNEGISKKRGDLGYGRAAPTGHEERCTLLKRRAYNNSLRR